VVQVKQRLANWLRRFPLLGWGLRLGVKLIVPRHHVGAVGVVFNEVGQVLLVKHVFRRYPWGLPGGWIERGEDPAETVRREFTEELGLQVTVGRILLCEPQGAETGVPAGLGLVYLCSLPDDHKLNQARLGYELLSIEWVDPAHIDKPLTPLERKAIALARDEAISKK
jgi:8-oxo-dGTP pyrophosphatase MutT (NUDIX family)